MADPLQAQPLSTAQETPGNPPGARVNPTYIERNPQMWAVSETDMKGLSALGVSANVSFSIGAFLIGAASNIILNYGGNDKLTPVQGFLLNRGTWIAGIAGILFFGAGFVLSYQKHSMWDQIKRESRPVQRN